MRESAQSQLEEGLNGAIGREENTRRKGGSLKLWSLNGQVIGKELNVAPGGLVLRVREIGSGECRIAIHVGSRVLKISVPTSVARVDFI